MSTAPSNPWDKDEWDKFFSSPAPVEPSANARTAHKAASNLVEFYNGLIAAGMPPSVASEIVASIVTSSVEASIRNRRDGE